ncbi:MAG: hypothetical protein IJD92_04330 [Bacilli bacterium]|nr:hypothetical protein [Bacilli bacterium]
MFNSIFYSFGRTLGRILCYIFIAFILFIIFSSMKGDINIWEIIKENLLF